MCTLVYFLSKIKRGLLCRNRLICNEAEGISRKRDYLALTSSSNSIHINNSSRNLTGMSTIFFVEKSGFLFHVQIHDPISKR